MTAALRESLTAPGNDLDLARHIIEFDPRLPSGLSSDTVCGFSRQQCCDLLF